MQNPDPTVRGVVLIRIQTLDGLYKGVFAGDYGVGPVVDADTIHGVHTKLCGEVPLPLARPAPGTGLGAGWTSWRVRQGVDSRWQCVGVQIDSAAGTEVIVAAK